MNEPQSSLSACCVHGCEMSATSRIFWPGREPQAMCTDHWEAAFRIAEAMGFLLHVEQLEAAE